MPDNENLEVVGDEPQYEYVTDPMMLDSTGQEIKDELTAIKSAVQGLGTALGSDRALIDGSNIGDKATFRTNIGLVSETITLTGLITGVFYSRCKKYGNVVDLYVELLNVNNTSLDNIIQLPSSIIPDHRITFDNLVLNTNADTLKGYGRGQVDPTGYLKYQVLGTYAATFATIHVVYVI